MGDMQSVLVVILSVYVVLGIIALGWVFWEQRKINRAMEEEDVESTFAQRRYLSDLRLKLGWSPVGIHDTDREECSAAIREAKKALEDGRVTYPDGRTSHLRLQEDDGEC
jgi:hypothetical protein